MKKIIKILAATWAVSLGTNIRHILGPIKDFGTNQQLEYLTYQIPLSIIAGIILAAALLIISLTNARNTEKQTSPKYSYVVTFIALFATILAALSTLLASSSPRLSFYWIAVLSMYGLPVILLIMLRRRDLIRIALKTTVIMGAVNSMTGITQYALGHTLGLRLLGEITANSSTPGVAKLIVDGFKLLRPVGLFPHANIFGGYLVVSLLISFVVINFSKKGSVWRRLAPLIIGIITIGAALSYSRGAWLGLMAALTLGTFYSAIIRKSVRVSILLVFAIVILFLPSIKSRFYFGTQEEQLSIRRNLSGYSITLIKEHPWLGIGPRNFVWLLDKNKALEPYEKQPVHNSFMYLATEFGLLFLGLLVFLLLIAIFGQIRRKNYYPGIVALSTLPLLWFDHYLVSLTVGIGMLSILFVSFEASKFKS